MLSRPHPKKYGCKSGAIVDAAVVVVTMESTVQEPYRLLVVLKIVAERMHHIKSSVTIIQGDEVGIKNDPKLCWREVAYCM